MSQPYSILIVDSDSTQQTLQNGLSDSPHGIPLIVSSTGSAARTAIMDRRLRLAGMILNPVVNSPGVLQLVSLSHLHRPATPIHLIFEKQLPFSREEMDRLAISGAVSRLHLEDLMKDRFAAEIFDPHLPGTTGTPMEANELNEEGFIPVPATDFLSGHASFFDIHVRLPSGRFLKIVEAKDIFLPRRVLGYVSKGVQHFYLKRESHNRCLSYCDVMAKQLLTHREASIEVRISEVFNRGQDFVDLIRQEGYRDEHADFMRSFLSSTRAFVQELKLDDQDAVRCLMNHLVGYQDAVSTTLVASLLTLPLKIESSSAFQIVGAAALLHDVGLYQLPESVQQPDRTHMTARDRELYHQHPQLGADLLARSTMLDASVLQAIAQHHERRDNQGFPGKAGASEINRVAEIVGISDAFVELLRQARRDPERDPLQEMETLVFDGYSLPVVDAFRTVFMKNLPRKR